MAIKLREYQKGTALYVEVLTELRPETWGDAWKTWWGRHWNKAYRVLRQHWSLSGSPIFLHVCGWFDWHNYSIVVCAWNRGKLVNPPIGRELQQFSRVAKECAYEMYTIPALLGLFFRNP